MPLSVEQVDRALPYQIKKKMALNSAHRGFGIDCICYKLVKKEVK